MKNASELVKNTKLVLPLTKNSQIDGWSCGYDDGERHTAAAHTDEN